MHIHCVCDVLIGQQTNVLLQIHLQWQLVSRPELYKKKAYCLNYAVSEINYVPLSLALLFYLPPTKTQYFAQPSPILFNIFYIEIHTDYRHYEGNIIFRKKTSTRKAQAILKTPPFYGHFRFELKWLNVTFLAEQKR